MNGTKKKKGIIIAVVLLSAVLLAGIAVAVVFGLRAVWRKEVVEDMSVPSTSQSITIKINSYGVSAGEKYSGERVIKYDPVRQGLWLYVSYDNGCVFAFDDVGVRVYGDPASEDAFIETFECGADIFSEYGGVWEDFESFIFERRDEAVDGVWERGDEYSVRRASNTSMQKRDTAVLNAICPRPKANLGPCIFATVIHGRIIGFVVTAVRAT